ncbi:hypothetical protein C8Q77DRAFT_1160342 [Trametes polyzona]|nr:hypothetical protein C8Q77DRAFT_1160342 [Trametes polyzona]
MILEDSYALRQVARTAIRNDIAIYRNVIADLLSRLNAFTAIGSLPTEHLSEIFLLVALEFYNSANSSYLNYYDRPRPSWIKVAHVGRLFRAVALATPKFWSYVLLFKKQTLSHLVALSGTVPLSVSARISPHTDRERLFALDILLQESRRLRVFHILGPLGIIQSLWTELSSPLHLLRTLILKAEMDSPLARVPAISKPLPVMPILTPAGLVPQLRHVELENIPFHWSDPIWSTQSLASLALSWDEPDDTGRPYPDSGSLGNILRTLQAVAPRLEVLVLENIFPRSEFKSLAPQSLHPPSCSIAFPNLQSLRLSGKALHIAHLLNHFVLPASAAVSLKARDKAAPLDAVLDTLVILCWRTPGDTGTVGDELVRLEFGPTYGRSRLEGVLRLSGSLFARVQHLQLTDAFAVHKWADVFVRFSGVRSLDVQGDPRGDDILSKALETLRRYGVPRERRICRFCRVQSHIEDEAHILLFCPDPVLTAARDQFHRAVLSARPNLLPVRNRLTDWQFLAAVLLDEQLASAAAVLVHSTFTRCKDVSVVHISSEEQWAAVPAVAL